VLFEPFFMLLGLQDVLEHIKVYLETLGNIVFVHFLHILLGLHRDEVEGTDLGSAIFIRGLPLVIAFLPFTSFAKTLLLIGGALMGEFSYIFRLSFIFGISF